MRSLYDRLLTIWHNTFLEPSSNAFLVNGPGPSTRQPMSPGPQLLEYMSMLSSLCTKAADSVASVDLIPSSKRRMPNTRQCNDKGHCVCNNNDTFMGIQKFILLDIDMTRQRHIFLNMYINLPSPKFTCIYCFFTFSDTFPMIKICDTLLSSLLSAVNPVYCYKTSSWECSTSENYYHEQSRMDKTQGFPALLPKDIQITSAMFIREFFLKDVQ